MDRKRTTVTTRHVREIVRMRREEGMTYKAIGDVLGIGESTVAKYLKLRGAKCHRLERHRAKIEAWVRNGVPYSQIARLLGDTRHNVSVYCKQIGVAHPHGQFPQTGIHHDEIVEMRHRRMSLRQISEKLGIAMNALCLYAAVYDIQPPSLIAPRLMCERLEAPGRRSLRSRKRPRDIRSERALHLRGPEPGAQLVEHGLIP
jgi:DNA-binding CsgD family transcriptional regulator